MILPTPDVVAKGLSAAGVRGIDQFCVRLAASSRKPGKYRDLLTEAIAARTLSGVGFRVEMRDRPDLKLTLAGSETFAEVKHFWRKEQDDVDEKRLAAHGRGLVMYGDTSHLEGRAAADQVMDVVRKKLVQLCSGTPNLLIVESSSNHCVEESEIADAIAELDDAVAAGDKNFRLLNGIVFLSPSTRCRDHRNVYFFETRDPMVPLSPPTRSALAQLQIWTLDMSAVP